MSINNSLLDQIYNQAKAANLCHSKFEFSQRLAGRSKRWLSTVTSQQCDPSAISLITISTNINRYAQESRKRYIIQAAKEIASTINKELSKRISVSQNEQKH
jgi:hypothetical protein